MLKDPKEKKEGEPEEGAEATPGTEAAPEEGAAEPTDDGG